MKNAVSIYLLIHVLFTSGQEKFESTKIADGISVRIPSSLVSMTDGERIDRFVSSKTPLAAYTSTDRLVDFAINTTVMPWQEGDEALLRDFYKGTYEALFDEIEYLQDTIKEINGKKFIVFEFVSSLEEENAFSGTTYSRHYSYIQYTSYKGKILLFNFGTRPRQMSTWQPIVAEIMNSVRVKK